MANVELPGNAESFLTMADMGALAADLALRTAPFPAIAATYNLEASHLLQLVQENDYLRKAIQDIQDSVQNTNDGGFKYRVKAVVEAGLAPTLQDIQSPHLKPETRAAMMRGLLGFLTTSEKTEVARLNGSKETGVVGLSVNLNIGEGIRGISDGSVGSAPVTIKQE